MPTNELRTPGHAVARDLRRQGATNSRDLLDRLWTLGVEPLDMFPSSISGARSSTFGKTLNVSATGSGEDAGAIAGQARRRQHRLRQLVKGERAQFEQVMQPRWEVAAVRRAASRAPYRRRHWRVRGLRWWHRPIKSMTRMAMASARVLVDASSGVGLPGRLPSDLSRANSRRRPMQCPWGSQAEARVERGSKPKTGTSAERSASATLVLLSPHRLFRRLALDQHHTGRALVSHWRVWE